MNKLIFILLLLLAAIGHASDDYEPGNESRTNRIRQANEYNLYDETRDRRVEIRRVLLKIKRLCLREHARRLIKMRECINDCSGSCIHDLIKTSPPNGEPEQSEPQPETPELKVSDEVNPELREIEEEIIREGDTKAIIPKPARFEIPELENNEHED